MYHEIFAHCSAKEKYVAAASGEWSSAVMTPRTAHSYSNKSQAWEVKEWIITVRVTSATLSGRPGLAVTTLASQFVRFTLSIVGVYCFLHDIFFYAHTNRFKTTAFSFMNLPFEIEIDHSSDIWSKIHLQVKCSKLNLELSLYENKYETKKTSLLLCIATF